MNSTQWPNVALLRLVWDAVKAGKSTSAIAKECRKAGFTMKNGNKMNIGYISAMVSNKRMRTTQTFEEVLNSKSKPRARKLKSATTPEQMNDLMRKVYESDLSPEEKERRGKAILSGELTKETESLVIQSGDHCSIIGQTLTGPDVTLPSFVIEHIPIVLDAVPQLEKLWRSWQSSVIRLS